MSRKARAKAVALESNHIRPSADPFAGLKGTRLS